MFFLCPRAVFDAAAKTWQQTKTFSEPLNFCNVKNLAKNARYYIYIYIIRVGSSLALWWYFCFNFFFLLTLFSISSCQLIMGEAKKRGENSLALSPIHLPGKSVKIMGESCIKRQIFQSARQRERGKLVWCVINLIFPWP